MVNIASFLVRFIYLLDNVRPCLVFVCSECFLRHTILLLCIVYLNYFFLLNLYIACDHAHTLWRVTAYSVLVVRESTTFDHVGL